MFRYMVISRAIDGLGGDRPPASAPCRSSCHGGAMAIAPPRRSLRTVHRFRIATSAPSRRTPPDRTRTCSGECDATPPIPRPSSRTSRCPERRRRAVPPTTLQLATDADVRSGHGSVGHRTRPDHSRLGLSMSRSDGWPAMDYVTLATRPMTVSKDRIYPGRMFTIPSGAFTPSIVRLRRTMGELRAIKASFGL